MTIPDFLQAIEGEPGYTQDIIDGPKKILLKVYRCDEGVRFTVDDKESRDKLISAVIYKCDAESELPSLKLTQHGFQGTFKREVIDSFLLDGTMTLLVTTKPLRLTIPMLFDDPTYSDVTVQVNSTTGTESHKLQLHLHKIILFKYSPVFKTMLLSGMTESVTNTIVIDEFSVSVVRTFFRLMYAGPDAIFALQRIDEVEEVWRMSRMYDFKALECQCEEVLGNTIIDNNCLRLLKLSMDLGCDLLRDKCVLYLQKHPLHSAGEIIDMLGVEDGLQLIDVVF